MIIFDVRKEQRMSNRTRTIYYSLSQSFVLVNKDCWCDGHSRFCYLLNDNSLVPKIPYSSTVGNKI